MSSQKSTADAVAIREPRRQRGRDRVAALLRAATAVFAERGYEATTMTEVAARAGAAIGSLYQFFPSKEALADVLLAGYGEQVLAGLQAIEAQAADLSIPALADALIDLLVGLREERAAVLALIEARRDAATQPSTLRDSLRASVARILARRAPGLAPDQAMAMAVVVLLQMKAAAALSVEPGLKPRAAAVAELRRLTRLYLLDGLGAAQG
ncbi:TetR/AcrR family transcriptional regulator [Inquilinus limosus]|uniref:TetR/AcrR family transcriptional regulator n=1 Tax=Inquilinus limosus TaxID=171674 RepID=UPI000404A796|nr:TetR/AcrR family transcriptional regulator [Inquilinus limosus]